MAPPNPNTAKPPKKRQNPLSSAIVSWLSSLPSPLISPETHTNLISLGPKRWVVYPPMLLLPSGSLTAPAWADLFTKLTPAQITSLWTSLLAAVSPPRGPPLTHLAVNEGIPLRTPASPSTGSSTTEEENVLRSPSGLRLLHGDFGPLGGTDFGSALWVSTRQNGIVQTWAPRWTMFSRGNVKEKARLLGFPSHSSREKENWAVDLYAGIGYFVFSYARLGMRVLAWELNPWSAEGLRRGAVANGWSVRVVQGEDLARRTGDVVGREQIVVFLEDNARAAGRIAELRAGEREVGVSHVNCGFLPSSEKSWRTAWDIQVGGLGPGRGGWLHLHENVGVAGIESRRREILGTLDGWREAVPEAEARVGHVELVKTFAPDVWHCVFDVHVSRASGTSPPTWAVSH